MLDLSPLNRFLKKDRFKMETPASIRASIREGDWATSIDLRDAYFHVLIHQRDRKWLRFVWRGTSLQFRALPFGLSSAPLVFTKIVKELAAWARERGIRLHCYLDDWLILAHSRLKCSNHTEQVLTMARRLGFCPNESKCDLVPSQQFDYLGMSFDTTSLTVRPVATRVERLQTAIQSLLQSEWATARTLAGLLGMMESLSSLVPQGRLLKRPLQREVRRRWRPALLPWSFRVKLGPWFRASVSQWLDTSSLLQGVRITDPLPQVFLYTDASCMGWGGHLESLNASGMWSQAQLGWHINRLELEAVFLSLQAFQPAVEGKSVRLFTDNTTVAFYINKQGGARSAPLSLRAEEILQWCLARNICLSARHIPGKLNIVADALSRPHCVLHTEWTIHRGVLSWVWEVWFRPVVDLFATKFNYRLPLYVSPVADPAAWAIDAFSISWSGILAYAFPPLPILSRVIRKAREDQSRMILIAPRWPSQPWFTDLTELCHLPPLLLPIKPDLLVQPRSGIRHGSPESLNLHAWLLCGKLCDHPAPQCT